MKVLLIKPYKINDHIQPSLGLGYLAQSIRKNHDVRILDCIKENIKDERLFMPFLDRFNPDVVGFQVYTQDLARVKSDLSLVKKWKPDVVTIVGGPHPSALPDETFLYMGETLDYIFIGESETSLPLFLEALESGYANGHNRMLSERIKSVPGLACYDNGRFFMNENRILISDLDSLIFPAWDLIHPDTYPEAQHGAFFKSFPIAPIMTSRGCPFSCTFCAGHIVTGRKVRRRSVDNVIGEIDTLIRDYGIKEIHIVDDNFTMDRDYVISFSKRLIDEKIKISWATPNGIRLDTLDTQMLTIMKDSGYYLASVGIEFGSDRILGITKKRITKKEISDKIKLIKKMGLDIAGFFIIGYPGETEKEIRQTIKFACDLPLLRANFFIFLPLPATEAYFKLKEQAQLSKVNWEKFSFTNASYVYDGFSAGKLKNLQREAFLRFYLRPYILYGNLSQIKNLRHLFYLIKRLYHWVIRG